MIEEVALAIDEKDYKRAALLLEQLPLDDPQVLLQMGRFQEATQAWAAAEATYRQLLRANAGTKATLAARQGIERVEAAQQQVREEQHEQARIEIQAQVSRQVDSDCRGLSALVLEAVDNDAKTALAQEFAKIMNIEPYAARLLLPSRGWRLYRSGQFPDLQAYAQQLQAVGVPLFCYPLAKLEKIKVLEVSYFQASAGNQATVLSTSGDIHAEPQPFTFAWSEVQQRLEGQIPIFEQVVDRDQRGKMLRKEQVQDYVQFCDLHLPKRQTILRIYSGAYQFHQGMDLSPATATASQVGGKSRVDERLANATTWANWQHMHAFLEQNLPNIHIVNEFSGFAETALDHPDLLQNIPAHIHLFRREEESLWDPAFHLYSCMAFWRYQP
jgi:hypothetical protein